MATKWDKHAIFPRRYSSLGILNIKDRRRGGMSICKIITNCKNININWVKLYYQTCNFFLRFSMATKWDKHAMFPRKYSSLGILDIKDRRGRGMSICKIITNCKNININWVKLYYQTYSTMLKLSFCITS